MKEGKIPSFFLFLLGVLSFLGIIEANRRADKAYVESNRINAINRTMFHWIDQNADDKYFQRYFEKRRIKKIAIYGMSSLGELLYYHVKDTGVEIAYLMDKGAGTVENRFGDTPIYGLNTEKNLPEVDAIIVTPVYYYSSIEEDLRKRNIPAKKIISIEKVVNP